jgi:hypothetical protein
MLADFLLSELLFPKDIISVFNRRAEAFKEIFEHSIENKLESLCTKYRSFGFCIPISVFDSNYVNLEKYSERNDKNSMIRTNEVLMQLYIFIIRAVIAEITKKYGNVEDSSKFMYFFLNNNHASKGYNSIFITFSVPLSVCEDGLLDSMFSSLKNSIFSDKSKRILIGNANIVSSSMAKMVQYYYHMLSCNDSRMSRMLFGDENPFAEFVNHIFEITRPRMLSEYFRVNKIRYVYQLKSMLESMGCIKFRNILVPKISRIMEKTIRKINQIRNVDRNHIEPIACSSNATDILLKSISDDIERQESKKSSNKREIRNKDEEITIHRLLITYRKEIRGKILPIFVNNQEDVRNVSFILEKMMFQLYRIFARSPDSMLSLVGESIHGFRLSQPTNEIKESHVSQKMNAIISLRVLSSFSCYDIYRMLMSYEMEATFGFRKSIISIYELLSENIPSIYDNTTKLANNFFLIGDPSGGKDLILETIETNHIEKTIMKESRSSTHADSSESHGRHDDEIVFNTERSLDQMVNSKGYNFSGDTGLKDRMTSFRSVCRVLHIGTNGTRQTKIITNERKVMFYDASNPSVLSRLDGGFYDRYSWLFMIPTTYQTSSETMQIIIQQKMMEATISEESRRKSFKEDNQYMQLITYEMSKFPLICNSEIYYKGVYQIMQYIIKSMEKDIITYGCKAIPQRKIDTVISLARCHMLRRIVVKHYFKRKNNEIIRYDPKYIFNEILARGKFYISSRDLTLALGQMAPCLGIFGIGELAMLTALRCIFIKTSYHQGFSSNEKDSYRISINDPRYVIFSTNTKDIASKCLETILDIWNREEKSPQPVNHDTCYDFINQLFDIDKYNREMCKRPIQRQYDIYSFIYINPISGLLEPVNSNGYNLQQDVIDEPLIKRCPKTNTCMVHIRHINRLFDPEMIYYPWTHRMPQRWSPIVNEDSILKKHLEMFFSYANQYGKSKKIVYRMRRLRLYENLFFSSYHDAKIRTLHRHTFECIRKTDFYVNRPFMMTTISNDSETSEKPQKQFPLYLNIDIFAHYNLLMNPDKVMEKNTL